MAANRPRARAASPSQIRFLWPRNSFLLGRYLLEQPGNRRLGEFLSRRRLLPRLNMAIASGHVPLSVRKRVEMLIARLPELCGPQVQPTLLHGDAHHNNFLSTNAGALMIDPAVYYGHPELDLAYLDLFSPVPADVLDEYKEMALIDTGFEERRDLWRVSAWLGIVARDGSFLQQLVLALEKYA